MVCRPRRIYSPRRPHHLHLRPVARDPPAPRAAREVRKSTRTTGIWPQPAKVVISVLKRSRIEAVRALPPEVASDSEYHRATLQEATLPLGPFPLPDASQQQLGVEGAFKQAKRPVRLCIAEQVKHARLQHRLERKEDRSSSAGVAGDCFGV